MTTTRFTRTGTLSAPGANVYYEVRGSGPLLLISQSGEGDANRSSNLVDHLTADYTVVTYDRRGLSRSTLTDPARPGTLPEHADDVHRLLATLTDEPALMLGCSLGAAIGLHLVVRHPTQVRALVAHEPVAPWLLPASERAHQEQELFELQETYRTGGLPAAFPQIARVVGIDPANQDTEPNLTPQPLTPQRAANFDLFIRHDFTAAARDTLSVTDIAGLTETHIVPAVGRTTPRTVFDYRCAQELARLRNTELAEFPGGHNGNTTHPMAYAAQLRRVLRSVG
ncbi:alpha/beta fold hydrolase [Micromonospora parathelypteridis]|uniref:Pimeloyl-ACP methyl ester carboxylesterase n=1 Tax=Micromonospora parathelypteridis TaxID=1839617 RepID=A0A840VRH0_9ACTN|nr:alpha/beta hydrolase [Micromonospora parathelypteridis]MBB5479803.1 pimeloyl-ACP methyl ester carboxylesterase [Micromonospora parathelypteridis]GGO31593.1 alpha/beta hydrolase [Micromonospora parathelypteridis]